MSQPGRAHSVWAEIDWQQDQPAEDLVWTFWFNAQTYATKRYGRLVDQLPQVDLSDLQILATDALMKLGKRFDAIKLELAGPGARKAVFWHFAKRDIDQDVLNLIHGKRRYLPNAALTAMSSDGDEFDSPELARTQLHAPIEHSTLLPEMVEAISMFEPAEQFTLALRFYEQTSTRDMARIIGIAQSSVDERVQHATLRTLNVALRLVEADPPEQLKAPAPRFLHHMQNAETWTSAVYGCDLQSYLAYVRIMYRADVAPVRSMIDRANGVFSGQRVEAYRDENPRSNVRNGYEMSDEQVREIRKRLAAGEMGKDIAAAYGVTKSVISLLKNGKTYAYVT